MVAKRITIVFITFEGGEGVGKTTQVNLAEAALKELKIDVCKTKEPGWGVLGSQLRNMILHPLAESELTPMAELMLLMADRANHVTNFIEPALSNGSIVLCDRYIDSTLAYQGWGRGMDHTMIRTLNNYVTKGLEPDMTFFLDMEVSESLHRSQDQNRMERLGTEFHERVKVGFRLEALKQGKRTYFICASNSIEIVHAEIMDAIIKKICDIKERL